MTDFLLPDSDTENASVEKLLSNDHPDGCEQTLKQIQELERRTKARRYLRILRDAVIYALALWGLFNIISQAVHDLPKVAHREHHHHEHSHQEHLASLAEMPRSCACGHSTAEAISLGCVYDSLSPAWMQPHCQDAELTAEFETLGDGPNGTWIYYSDRNHTQELSMPEVMAMADDADARFHVTWEWHVVHCYMYWIKQFRAPTTGIVVEARYDSEDHIRHCARVFQNPVWGTSSGVVLNADIDDD
jgi:hypothetical protein